MVNNRGTAVVEFSISAVMVVMLILMILSVAYFYFAKVTISNSGYNALICIAERQPKSACQRRAKKTLEKHLPLGHLDQVQLKQSNSWFRVNINWTFFNDHKVHYSKSLRY